MYYKQENVSAFKVAMVFNKKKKGKSRKHIGACGNRKESQKYYQQKGHVIQNL